MNAGCSYKQAFGNKRQANQIAQKTNRRRDKSLNCYRCIECKLWHVGTPSHKPVKFH